MTYIELLTAWNHSKKGKHPSRNKDSWLCLSHQLLLQLCSNSQAWCQSKDDIHPCRTCCSTFVTMSHPSAGHVRHIPRSCFLNTCRTSLISCSVAKPYQIQAACSSPWLSVQGLNMVREVFVILRSNNRQLFLACRNQTLCIVV